MRQLGAGVPSAFLPGPAILETETRSGLICQELDVAMCESDSDALTDCERFDKPCRECVPLLRSKPPNLPSFFW